MLNDLPVQAEDALLALIGLYRDDPRKTKIDLGVGMYRDDLGKTVIMRAVKEAERRLWEAQDSKAYVGPEGDLVFTELLAREVLGAGWSATNVTGVQTPGGSGALRLAAELLAYQGPRTIWVGTPSWPNHKGIFGASGLNVKTHPYFDPRTQTVLLEEMLAALNGASPCDAVLLHASCHNPSGAALADDDWNAIASVVAQRGLIPLIDSAYQGFGRGVDGDREGLQTILAACPEALVAVSCSKSFALYRERTGAIFVSSDSSDKSAKAGGVLASLARVNYSMPPAHGAEVVRTILADEELRADWVTELESMRLRLIQIRRALASTLSGRVPSMAAIAQQEGMFSLLPLSAEQVMTLRHGDGIYMPESGRINIAGLRLDQVDELGGKLLRHLAQH
ncbi:aromatic amino acid transaminase [Rhizobium leguminosarum]|uniref:aromatic amino acid transaminase n=1 Tax=Rhizobium leguminosarum TaxID=384 RepID=UPI00143F0F37|nr:aromatic amino acid transaminase [Rhizobium leguminosarum]NKL21260.1 aminotransferase class I/II-fold pyridoxal phosphate-dependent enzyme [Rhizobium leguminosarum bv. viciae]NKL56767.1 aminotransferase class I/II-fold pyridoxal phosphate-dependent enzyme [Rhizobium leguminosarum bv. viciae]